MVHIMYLQNRFGFLEPEQGLYSLHHMYWLLLFHNQNRVFTRIFFLSLLRYFKSNYVISIVIALSRLLSPYLGYYSPTLTVSSYLCYYYSFYLTSSWWSFLTDLMPWIPLLDHGIRFSVRILKFGILITILDYRTPVSSSTCMLKLATLVACLYIMELSILIDSSYASLLLMILLYVPNLFR